MNNSQKSTQKRILVIGAGVAGAATARHFADSGAMVDLHEKSDHVAGHCYDKYDEHGVLIHCFGPHYFRTDSDELLAWLSRFTDWIPGKYYVRAKVGDKLIPLPISLSTISALKDKKFTEEDFKAYLDKNREPIEKPKNAEEQCLALLGKELYEAFFKNYTIKQWGIHPKDLDASVTARIPLRFDWDERYPVEKHQLMPKEGYTKMFEKIIDHTDIALHLNSDLSADDIWSKSQSYDATIYTGPVDALYDFQYGHLKYRSLEFEWKHFKEPLKQPCVQVNYPNDFDYTRSVEAKHVTGQECDGTTVCYEYPKEDGPPYYPLLIEESRKMYAQYEQLVKGEKTKKHNIYLVGRLAEFRYFNMDQVFIRSLELAKTITSQWT